jgi:hypothetical protein
VIAAIVIASVVAYFVGAGAAYGYFQEWHRVHGEYPEEIACGTVTLGAGIFVCFTCWARLVAGVS